jgi:hypothetical protein
MFQWPKQNDALGTVNRGNPAESGLCTPCDKLQAGLQQLLAGARKFSVGEISRDDLFSANRETERETGIPFVTEIEDERAKAILEA